MINCKGYVRELRRMCRMGRRSWKRKKSGVDIALLPPFLQPPIKVWSILVQPNLRIFRVAVTSQIMKYAKRRYCARLPAEDAGYT